MTPLMVLAMLAGGALGLGLLRALAKISQDYLKRVRAEDHVLQLAEEHNGTPESPPAEPVSPPNEWASKAQEAWQELFSRQGVFGFMLTPVEGAILVINSYLIAISMEVIIGHPGPPICVLNLLGWERVITAFDLYGLLISLAQMILGAAFHQAQQDNDRTALLLTIVPLVCLISVEGGAAYERGRLLSGHFNAVLSFLLALGIAGTEVRVGKPVLLDFFSPLIQAPLYSFGACVTAVFSFVTAPFRLLIRQGEKRLARRPQPQVIRSGNRFARGTATAMEAVGLVLEPFDQLDQAAGQLYSRLTQPKQQPEHMHKGGNGYASQTIPAEIQDTGTEPRPGREPVGM